jgi:hypothetical protein
VLRVTTPQLPAKDDTAKDDTAGDSTAQDKENGSA